MRSTDTSFPVPELGVGMIFSTALMPFLRRRTDALDVLEIEPQTLWLADDPFSGPFFEYAPGIEAFALIPGRKLIHSVGVPLGGKRQPNPDQMKLIAESAKRLDSPWVSEHLSVGGTPHEAAGFFLPPLQTEEGVATAVRNICEFREAIGRPVAIETGVAYLKRKPFEMRDGEFVARIVEEADCGILLDLHNLYCNERNGRNTMDDFLSDIPLERVWEIHLAGGMPKDGYWLDSHSGPMPDDLFKKSIDVVQQLPNLGALNFEIYSTFLERLEQKEFDRTVDQLRMIWDRRRRACSTRRHRSPVQSTKASSEVSIQQWEEALTQAVWKADSSLHPWQEDAPAVDLYSMLARSFRSSMLTRALPRTIRYLLLRDGASVNDRLSRYFGGNSPKMYAPLEAHGFAEWLKGDGETDRILQSLIDFDLAFLRVVREGTPVIVQFPGNPAPVFEALAEKRLPEIPDPPTWELEILPDNLTVGEFAGSAPGS